MLVTPKRSAIEDILLLFNNKADPCKFRKESKVKK